MTISESEKTLKKWASEDLKRLQALPLEEKIKLARANIKEWYEAYNGKVAVSFSGGKDSTVLLHLVRQMYPDVPAIFADTGLEFPAIKQIVKSQDNIVVVRPKMNFAQVLTKYGYPIISKEVASTIEDVQHMISRGHARNNKPIESTSRYKQLYGIDKYSSAHSQFNKSKWIPLLNVDFRISARCCGIIKEKPVKEFCKQNDLVCYVGTMASESTRRKSAWIHYGCNVFSDKNPVSKPMSVWTENDVFKYLIKYNLKIANVYGSIQFDQKKCRYYTTGCDRTGCTFCGFGISVDKGKRYEILQHFEPRLYEFAMDGGEYDSEGKWIPNKNGLGFAHIFDELNKIYGENFVQYKFDPRLF